MSLECAAFELTGSGGKFTIRLLHPITPALYESLLFSLIGDQFDESDNVVGCVLSVRQTEDIMSVWVEEEGEAVRSGALRYVTAWPELLSFADTAGETKFAHGLTPHREKILSLLGLPSTTICEYRSNKALLDAASSLKDKLAEGHDGHSHHHGHHNHSHHHGQGGQGFHQHQRHHHDRYNRENRDSYRDNRPREDGERVERRTGGWGNGFRREQQ